MIDDIVHVYSGRDKCFYKSKAVAWAHDTAYGRGYVFAQEFLDIYPSFPTLLSVQALVDELMTLSLTYEDYCDVKDVCDRHLRVATYD
jgi:hypothetical protein